MSNQIPSESDVWLAAGSMIRCYGGDAAAEAAQRAESSLKEGNLHSSATWQRIMAAIETLRAEQPEP
jgi:hypothetical protein